MSAITLFPDQEPFVNEIREALRWYRSVLAQAATGFGKTVVAAYIADEARARQKRVLFCTHRKDLIRQTALTFTKAGIPFGFIASGYPESRYEAVQIASIETLRRRLGTLPAFDLLYIDECHLACSPTWTQVIDHFRDAGARIIGNTATPQRLDGRPLGRHFQTMVYGPPVRDLIDAGRLSDFRIFAPSVPDLSKVHTRMGEYAKDELEGVMDSGQIVGSATLHYQKHMPGKRAIAFCVSLKHAAHVAEQFSAAGIPAAVIHGEMSDVERKRIILDFADGRVWVLVTVELVTTGFDLSAQVGRDVPVEGGIMLRPTQSLALWLQMLGRCLRKKPYPAIILDHAGGSLRHGLPDTPREWDLHGSSSGRKKKAEAKGPALRSCDDCFAVFLASKLACPSCGKAYKAQGRTPEVVDGELKELARDDRPPVGIRRQKLDPERAYYRLRRIQAARTIEDLVRVGIEFGYDKPGAWAAMKHYSRVGGDKAACFREAHRIAKRLTEQSA